MEPEEELADSCSGECNDCAEVFTSRAEMDTHISETFSQDVGRSHSVRIHREGGAVAHADPNPVRDVLLDALDSAWHHVGTLLIRGITTEEAINKELRNWPDFVTEDWEEYIA